MKNYFLLLVILLNLFSCQKKKDDAIITKFVCSQLLFTLDNNIAELKREVEMNGKRDSDIRSLKFSKRMEGWRNNYLKNKNRTNLLLYTDSISNWYVPFNNNEIARQLSAIRKVVSQSNDTLNYLNLFFWTLKSEEDMQNSLNPKLATGNPYFKLTLHINSIDNKLGDTIYAAFKISEIEREGWKYGFDSLYVINKNTQVKLPRTIIKTGPYFVIQTVPKEKGEYLIKGKVKVEVLKFKDYRWSYPLEKSFRVN